MEPAPASREFTIPGPLSVHVPATPGLMTAFILEELGDWFEDEIRFVRAHLRPGMGVVDIGANYGLYTLTCARQVAPTGRVWAYEPGSLPRGCLARSVAANQLTNIRLSPAALSDHCGSARLAIAANAELNRLDSSATHAETVPLTTLDAEARHWDGPVDFLKVDAEGEEVRILAGAAAFLAAHDPLMMFEYHQAEVDNLPLLEALRRQGAELYRHLPSLNTLVPLALAPNPAFLLNLFAARPRRAAQLAAAGALVGAPAPLPPSDPAADAATIIAWFHQRPWAAHFPFAHGAGSNLRYTSALADALRGEDPALAADLRLAYKQRAFTALRELVAERESLPRLLSAARLAMDLAEQPLSVDLLQQASRLSLANRDEVAREIDEPFLPPDRQHDTLAGEGTPAQVLAIEIDEPLLARTTYSVYYAGRKALPLLLRIAANPLRSAASERRLAAARRLLPL